MKIFNSLTQKKEEFVPLNGTEVKMYVCGITPYDTTHLGHAFTYTVFDTLQRYLKYKKYHVIYTQNVTDIDDDILRKAKETGKDWQELGKFWTDKYTGDMKTLNVAAPDYYVKATETMPTLIDLIKTIVKNGFAYEKNGNVFFDTQKFPEYGKLSHYNRNQMLLLSKERGADPDDPLKKAPLDFILWQKRKPGEPSWESPYGSGRPGWHIECSSMVYKYLGKQIDIHGGGRDLIYPHHESEIAQSESFTGEKPYAKYWLHTGAVMYQGEKMSKSLGNLVMVSDLLKSYSANTVRYILLSHHWRTPWEFQEEELETAKQKTALIEKALRTKPTDNDKKASREYLKQFEFAMDDDLNTAKALEIVNEIAQKTDSNQTNLQNALQTIMPTLGFADK